jgi:glycosyltransferase involved in cell wall biosynthesis
MRLKSVNKNPKFSVIIGTYNCKKFLKLAILSVLGQTFENFELIIVDDSSDDGSQNLIKKFAEKDKRIKFFFNKKNSGKDSAPRNFAIKKANGEYICFLDSDDLWTEDKLYIQNSKLEKDTILICTACEYINIDGEKHSSIFMHFFRKFLQKKFFKSALVSFYMYNPIIFSSVLIKTQIIKKYMFNENPEFIGIVDLELWLRLFSHQRNADKIIFINKDLVKIRRRSDSLNRDYKRASIRSMHCVSKSFIDRKNYKYFYIFIIGIALRSIKTLINYSYFKIRKFLLISLLMLGASYALIFQSPLFWAIGNYLIDHDKFEKKEALVILSGNGGSRYINLEYQKRFLDIKKIINNYDYKNIIILGREQEIDEVEILTALIVSDGFDKKKITAINDNFGSTFKNILFIDQILKKKNIKSINFVTAPWHSHKSKLIWKKNSNTDVNIIENIDNPFNYTFSKKRLTYASIKVIIYETLSKIYNKILGNID